MDAPQPTYVLNGQPLLNCDSVDFVRFVQVLEVPPQPDPDGQWSRRQAPGETSWHILWVPAGGLPRCASGHAVHVVEYSPQCPPLIFLYTDDYTGPRT